jgi:hypothetical protein
MQRTTTFGRVLVAALAIAAIAAPSSLARPIDYPREAKEPATESLAAEAPSRPLDRYTPESPEAAPKSVAPLSPRGPLYWSYDYEAARPQDRAVTTADDTPWAIIGLAITGSVLLLTGVTMASRNVVRARRARVAT